MEAHAIPAPRVSARRGPVRHSLLSDERLARLVATGDERAFATLYERYYQPLYRYCRSMLRHDADAQDALQSAMTSAYAALRRSQRDAPVRPWLFRIAHNESISVLRRRRPAAELTDDLGGTVASVEVHEERRSQLALLLADLKELPERQRGALVMRELSGLSHDDIALALNTSIGGAKQAIFEARRALSEFAEGRAMGCEEICRLVSDADGRVLRGRRVRAHLRDCSSCSAFASMIPSRTADLRALAPPLPAIAAAGLLSRAIGSSSAGGGIGIGGGGAGLAGALGGKTATLGLLAKAVTAVAVVSGATVGITTATEHGSAVQQQSTQPVPVVQTTATGAATPPAVLNRGTSQAPGAPSATRRSNAAPAAGFGQQTSQAARSAVHGKSGLAPAGSTLPGSVKTQPTHPTHPTTPSSGAPAHSAGSTQAGGSTGSPPGATVSSTKSQQGQTHSQQGQTTSLLHSTTGQTAHSQHTHVVTTPKGLVPPGL